MPTILRAKQIMPNVTTYADLQSLALRNGLANGAFSSLTDRSDQIDATVNVGRWMLRCVVCDNGVPLDPDWPQIVCVDCGSVYTPVYPPPAMRLEIESLLFPRPRANQNWDSSETTAFLRQDNTDHGIENPPSLLDPGTS